MATDYATPYTPVGQTRDAQNPWFGQSNPALPSTGTPTPNNYGKPINSTPQNPGGLKDMSQWLDASKWQSWSDDDWRAATGGFGFEGGLMGNLRAAMGDPNGNQQYHNMLQSYGVGGSKYMPGRFDFSTGKMVYGDDPTGKITSAANAAPLYSGPTLAPTHQANQNQYPVLPETGYIPPPSSTGAPKLPTPPPGVNNPATGMPYTQDEWDLLKSGAKPTTPTTPTVEPSSPRQRYAGLQPTSMTNLFRL